MPNLTITFIRILSKVENEGHMKNNGTQTLTEALKNLHKDPQNKQNLLKKYSQLLNQADEIKKWPKETFNPGLNPISHFNEKMIDIYSFIKENYGKANKQFFSPLEYLKLKHIDKITTKISNYIEEKLKKNSEKTNPELIETKHKEEYKKIFDTIFSKIYNLKSSDPDSTVKEVYSDLVNNFDTIINFYIELGRFTGEPKYYTYSAIFCQNALKLIEKHSLDNIQKFNEKYFEIKKLALKAVGIDIEKLAPQDVGIDINTEKLELDNINTDFLIDKTYCNKLKDDLKKI